MASLNKVMILGNLGKDPELRYTPSGQAVASFSVATSERYRNKQSGEMEEKTEWHRVVLWGKQAEVAGEYLTKGKTVFIEGKLQTRKWTDRDGNDKYTTEIIGERMQMVGSKGEGGGGGGSSRRPESTGGGSETTTSYEDMPFQDDDIPF